MALPWAAIALLASTILPMLFKGKEPGAMGKGYQTPTVVDTTTTQSPTGYQSPMMGLGDPMAFEMLLRNMGQYSNWGGKNIGSPWIDELLKMMSGSTWPKLMEGYQNYQASEPALNPSTTPTLPGRTRI